MVHEVTTRLSSADPIQHSPVASPGASQGISCPTPGILTGLPLVVSDVRPPMAAPVPTAVTSSSVINPCVSPSHQLKGLPLVSSSGLADTVVQGSVPATQSALSDELPVINPVLPTPLFSVQACPLMLVYLTNFAPKYGITNL